GVTGASEDDEDDDRTGVQGPVDEPATSAQDFSSVVGSFRDIGDDELPSPRAPRHEAWDADEDENTSTDASDPSGRPMVHALDDRGFDDDRGFGGDAQAPGDEG